MLSAILVKFFADNNTVMVNTIVALDLGTTHIRGIEAILKKNSAPKIVKIHSVPLESNTVVSGNITNEETLTKALKKLWSEAKFSSKKVFTMATGDSFDNRVLNDMPWSPPGDFKKILPYYLRERLPFEVDDYYFDSHTLSEYYKESEADSQLYKKILVMGVHREHTDKLLKALENAGLLALGIDIMPLALIRAYNAVTTPPLNSTVVSIELGGDITTIVIHKNGQPLYINTATPLGGERITKAISQGLNLTIPESEMLKRSFSMSPEEQKDQTAITYFEDGTTRTLALKNLTSEQKEDAYNIVSREISNIISHVSDILEDAFTNLQETPYEVVLSGGGAELASLVPRIQGELGIPVRVLQPFNEESTKKVEAEVLAHQSSYVSIFGLLMGQVNE